MEAMAAAKDAMSAAKDPVEEAATNEDPMTLTISEMKEFKDLKKVKVVVSTYDWKTMVDELQEKALPAWKVWKKIPQKNLLNLIETFIENINDINPTLFPSENVGTVLKPIRTPQPAAASLEDEAVDVTPANTSGRNDDANKRNHGGSKKNVSKKRRNTKK